MKIKAIGRRGADLDPKMFSPQLGYSISTEFGLTVGATYIVLAIEPFQDWFFYYIIGDDVDQFPIWFPSQLFEVVDGRLSKYWQCGHFPGDKYGPGGPIISWNDWISDKLFYDRLVNGDEGAVDSFERMRRLIEKEGS